MSTSDDAAPPTLARPIGRRSLLMAGAALAVLPVTGCGALDWVLGPGATALRSLRFDVREGINGGQAVAVDVVFVYDRLLIDRLAGMTARQWFTGKKALADNFPRAFELLHWELAGGQRAPDKPLPANATLAWAVFLFADYRAKGAHRARLERFADPVITLDAQGFVVAEVPPGG